MTIPSRAMLVSGLLTLLISIPIAASFANGVISPHYPSVRLAVQWIIVLAVAFELSLLWQLWTKRRRTRVRELMELLALTPGQFEHAILDLLRDTGYRNVQHLGGSGDLAADLRATDRNGQSVVVQCKRLAPGTRIGSPEIQKFIGMTVVHHRADRGIFVTTAGYTEPAVSLARQHSIELWDGAHLSAVLTKLHSRDTTRPAKVTAIA
jgi:restriction endonuclease Mrr